MHASIGDRIVVKGHRIGEPDRDGEVLEGRARRGAREEEAMRVVDAHSNVEIIDRDECVRLLGTEEVGRLAFVVGGGAEVLPVNYALDGDAVVFATATGSKLWSAERGPVAFEVDHTDPAARSGWSVVVHGLAQEITSFDAPGLLERLQALALHPWAGGERPHLVRIAPHTITGRRVGPSPGTP